MIRTAVLIGGVLAARLAGAAPFEGVIDMKMTTPAGSGSGTVYLSGAGTRSQIQMPGPRGGSPFQIVSIVRANDQDHVTILNDARKTYAVVDTKMAHRQGGKDQPYTVKVLGTDTIAGYECKNVLLTQAGTPRESEYCLSTAFPGAGDWVDAMSRSRGEAGQAIMKAIRESGVQGMPIRVVSREPGKADHTVTMELVSAKAQAVPASMFEVPSGYTQESPMAAALPPGAAEKMQNALKNLPPEQRKAIENAVKQQPAGGW